MTGSALRSALMAAANLRTAQVDIDGTQVTVREVGTIEFAEYGQILKTDRLKATAKLISSCVVEDGQPVLSEVDAEDIARSARVAMKIVQAIMELSGFGGDDEKELDAS